MLLRARGGVQAHGNVDQAEADGAVPEAARAAPRACLDLASSPLPFFLRLSYDRSPPAPSGGSRGTAGRRISWRRVGRRRLLRRCRRARPTTPLPMDRWMASMIATSIRPSLPEGSGVLLGAHAFREMHELGRELVALGEFLALLLLADRELVAQALGVFECGIARPRCPWCRRSRSASDRAAPKLQMKLAMRSPGNFMMTCTVSGTSAKRAIAASWWPWPTPAWVRRRTRSARRSGSRCRCPIRGRRRARARVRMLPAFTCIENCESK